MKRFAPPHSSTSEKSAVLTNRRRQMRPHFWLPLMMWPLSHPAFSVRSKPMLLHGTEKKKPQKRRLVPPKDIPLSWPDVYWGFLKHRPNAVVPMVRCHFVPRKSPRGLFCSF